MSRSRDRHTAVDPPLFPFLAVLLCTLGVLVMLLTAMASVQMDGARKKLAESKITVDPAHQAEQESLRQALQEVERETARANNAREHASKRLELATDRLSVIEKSLREHQLRLEELRHAIAEQDALGKDHTSDLAEARKRLETLKARIEEKEAEIQQRREELSKQPTSYAILPYDGPNGTKRRPIYIECLKDRVVIQPEGIELGPADFNAALGQGTPLAAALRAARDYYRRQNDREKELPYPLILVRPEGVGTYLRVQTAVRIWDSAYGYEMVPADWKLDCGAPNPSLATDMQLAVANARTAALARAERAPGAYRQGSVESFDIPASQFHLAEAAAARGESRIEIDKELLNHVMKAKSEQQIDTSRIAMAIMRAESGSGQGNMPGPKGEGETGNTSVMPFGGGGGGRSPSEGFGGGGRREQIALEGDPSGTGAGEGERAQAPSGVPGSGNTPPGESQLAGQPTGQLSPAGQTGPAGQSGPAGLDQTPGATSADSGTNMVESDMSQQPAAPGAKSSALYSNAPPPPQGAQGAPGTGGGSAPSGLAPSLVGLQVERPVRVELRSDRIVVGASTHASPMSRAAEKTVMLGNDAQKTSEEFGKAIKDHVASWGTPGRDTEWKPVLVLYPEPGREALANELTEALRASGVEVRLPDTARR